MKWFLALALAMLVASKAFADISYNIVDLGTLGGSQSWSNGINNNGQVVGGSFVGPGTDHAFSYMNGSMTDLGTLGGLYSRANSVNDNGNIVGHAHLADNTQRAFLYSGGGMQNLGTLPGGTRSEATGISENETIVGVSWANFVPTAFVYNNGVMSAIPMNAGRSFAVAISKNANHITGEAVFDGETVESAFLTTGNATVNLGTLGGNGSSAQSVNNSGVVVGWSYDSTNVGPKAFRYANGLMQPLAMFPGAISSIANDVNEHGDIVGWASTLNTMSAFIYRHNGEMIDLKTLIDPNSGWTLHTANAINDFGQITGVGTNALGQTRAFLLNPIPSPATASLLLLNALHLRRKR